MRRQTICGNAKAVVLRALSEGPLSPAVIQEHSKFSEAATYKAIDALCVAHLITMTIMGWELTPKGVLVADALELLDIIKAMHERGGESEYVVRMHARAEHHAQRLVESLAREG